METQNVRAIWMNTIFKEGFEQVYGNFNFLLAVLNQMCLFHEFRPEDKIFDGILHESHDDREIRRKKGNIDKVLVDCRVKGVKVLPEKIEKDFLFIFKDISRTLPQGDRYNKSFISTVAKSLKITVILIKNNPKKPPEKKIFSYGELPIVIEKSQKTFFSIKTCHITSKSDENCWPNRWLKNTPHNFSIKNYLKRIEKHQNFSTNIYYAVEDFYCKFPWKEKDCFKYMMAYASFNKKVLYYPNKEAEKVEKYPCPYCKNQKKTEKNCLHCATSQKDLKILSTEPCSKCQIPIGPSDFLIIDDEIFHFTCYNDSLLSRIN
jgi:hypothetical protein